ncbi:MAG: heme A synthase [Pseudomonadota bacterium]
MSSKRSIFEEVGPERRDRDAPRPGIAQASRSARRRAIAGWLMALFALVVLMVAVGGLTRLTDSGLSITEWRPVTGAIPPLTAEDWAAAFEKYRAIPEYQLQNRGMSLAEFQVIYWWEWGHRQLGRVIGAVWAIGFFWFLARRQIPAGWTPRLLGLGALGGLQGAVGWWMVSSGLAPEMLDVASYRLAIHLGLAVIILGLIAWYVMLLRRDEVGLLQARRQRESGLMRITGALAALAFLQILLGALVAGIDAGQAYVDWPLMSGAWFPAGAFDLSPLWRNFFENPGLVQFNHRTLGYLLLLAGIATWLVSRRSAQRAVRRGADWVMIVLFAQMTLGIITLVSVSPLPLALLHQAGAVLTFVLILRARFLAGYPPAQSVRGG